VLTHEMLLEAALSNEARLDGTPESMKRVVDAYTLVFAIWRDPADRAGVAKALMKGHRRQAALRAASHDAPEGIERLDPRRGGTTWTAILFENREAAFAAQQEIGEPGLYNPSK
jgi:hypothetical protein